MAEKMNKKEMEKRIAELTGDLFDFELTEEQIEKIENSQEPKKSNINALEKMLDEALKTLEQDGKKAVFHWTTLDGYYKLKLATVTPEKIQKNWKISFRLDTKKIEKINDYFYYNNPEKSDFSSIDFENGQDIATVKSIDKNGIIKAVSEKNGGVWWIYPEDINGSKSTKCVLKDGSGIAFLVYAPVEK